MVALHHDCQYNTRQGGIMRVGQKQHFYYSFKVTWISVHLQFFCYVLIVPTFALIYHRVKPRSHPCNKYSKRQPP